MAMLIDVNTISKVFSLKDAEHQKFEPVRDWIINRKGKMIYGGTTYQKELKLLGSYNPLLVQLRTARKLIVVDGSAIDRKEKSIKSELEERGISKTNVKYNDSHIVAILAITKCKLLCTADRRSHSFIKDASFYDRSSDRPKIYSDERHISLLNEC